MVVTPLQRPGAVPHRPLLRLGARRPRRRSRTPRAYHAHPSALATMATAHPRGSRPGRTVSGLRLCLGCRRLLRHPDRRPPLAVRRQIERHPRHHELVRVRIERDPKQLDPPVDARPAHPHRPQGLEAAFQMPHDPEADEIDHAPGRVHVHRGPQHRRSDLAHRARVRIPGPARDPLALRGLHPIGTEVRHCSLILATSPTVAALSRPAAASSGTLTAASTGRCRNRETPAVPVPSFVADSSKENHPGRPPRTRPRRAGRPPSGTAPPPAARPVRRQLTHSPSRGPLRWRGGQRAARPSPWGVPSESLSTRELGSRTKTSAAMSGSKLTWDMNWITLRPVISSTAIEKRSRIALWK